MRKFVSVAMALLALLTFSGGSALADHSTTITTLHEQNNSGQSGTATQTLSEDDMTLTIEINITGGSDVPQPAHIHPGSCADLDPKPIYPLNDVVNGKSVTVITEEDLADVDYELYNQFAINVHKSAAEASVYVACGDIVPGGDVVVGMPTTGGSDNLAPVVAFVALGLVATGAGLRLRFARRAA